ncbi:Signal transduction histidine kinase [Lachnospiraceae bacterium NK3A20]|nr:Signal transduction histidine kinase [Lachnospiraceae bacterium NK3A20]
MPKEQSLFHKIREAYFRYPFFRSLKLRIFLLTFLVGVFPSLILTRGILANYEDRVVNVRTSEVQTQLRVLSNHLLLYGYLQNPTSDIVNAELAQFASFYDGRVLVIDDDLRVVKDTYEMATDKTAVSADVVNCLKKGSEANISRYVKADGYIEVIMPILETASLEDRDYSGLSTATDTQEMVSGVILASVSTDSMMAMLEVLGRRATLLEIVLFVLVFSIAMIMATLLVAPFDRLTKAISDVKSGFTSSDVQVSDYLETQHIQDAFNEVLGRMRRLDESRQEFVSNVSHELKTPMTSMKVLADSLLADPNTPAEMYREFLGDIDNEIDRENKIIAELLNLSKMDRKKVQMNVAPVNINELMENIMKRVRPIAQQRDVEMTLVSEREVTAEVDEVKLSMVFTNLIENAVKYNKEHGKVQVTINSDHKNMIVTVEDTGVGIPKESQGRIFERFYRVDKSRSREVGGTGLGLSITKSAVLLHRGTVELESTEGVGSKFTVTIPLNYIPETAPEAQEEVDAAALTMDAPMKKADQDKEIRTEFGNNKGYISEGSLRILGVIAASILALGLLAGCGKAGEDTGSLSVYYLNQDGSSITALPYEPSREKTPETASTGESGDTSEDAPEDTQKILSELMEQLSSPPSDVTLESPIQNFTVNFWVVNEGVVTIDFSKEYRKQDKIHEILVRAAIVNTLCQNNLAGSVTFTCEGEPLTDADGVQIGAQTADMFINNTGREIQNYERVHLHLYFANANGDQLVDTYRTVVYNSNISLERLVVEQVLKGPNSDIVFPTLNSDTKILSVTTRDGVCYVNLDQTFLTEPYNVTPQAAIYSLVNSLTELNTVRYVQISIDGNTNQKFMDNIPLTTVFDRNLTMVYEQEE